MERGGIVFVVLVLSLIVSNFSANVKAKRV